jgi:hypothetical protein
VASGSGAAGAGLPSSRAYVAPAIIAPATGASQNAHSCSIASIPANSAGPVDRAGFTEVLLTGMLTRWIRVSASPIAIGANPLGARVSVAPRMT